MEAIDHMNELNDSYQKEELKIEDSDLEESKLN